VKLINTDGMAFIGPGSEWFWTALSGIVLAITFIAIDERIAQNRDLIRLEQALRSVSIVPAEPESVERPAAVAPAART
jgi:hypothetical protein